MIVKTINSLNKGLSKKMQNIDVEFNGHTSSRLEVGAGTIMSQQQFQKYIVERIEKIMVLSEQNNACISRLLQTMSTFLNSTSKRDGLPELPLKNYDDFKKLEEMLSEKTVDAKGRETPAFAYTYLVRFKIIMLRNKSLVTVLVSTPTKRAERAVECSASIALAAWV
ncbi:uncharacterized protein LOC118646192 [Monomorium pharaonis]|uniref:uncharacterized protein LOC118646192 n=1 Tax=Monomorium pharaonis TaxID=307658 RepID=UPI0017468AE2|nr:uncharacterized protein LOC118646192 [Monomorium pharaonis]